MTVAELPLGVKFGPAGDVCSMSALPLLSGRMQST